MASTGLTLQQDQNQWRINSNADSDQFALANEYLAYLIDRSYSPQSVRTYGYGLLAFCRWLQTQDLDINEVTTDAILRFLAACGTGGTIRVP